MVDKLMKKSGMWHGIDDVTGKKIKDAFVDRELKKIYSVAPRSKKFLRRRRRKCGFSLLARRRFEFIKDGYRLASVSDDKKNLFNSVRLKNLKKNKYIPSVYNKK